MYSPKLVKGRIKNTNSPLDGHEFYFTQWDYDNYDSWHLAFWDKGDEERDNALFKIIYDSDVAAGGCTYDNWEELKAAWEAGEWESDGPLCFELNQVEVLKVIQKEQKE